MTKPAAEVMQEILFSAVIDSLAAFKKASKGLPNTLLRDLGAVHPNTTLRDLPEEVQAAIATGVRAAFTRLMREGYSVAPAGSAPPPPRPGGFPRDRGGPPRAPVGQPGRGGRPGGGRRSPGKPRGPGR